MKIKDYLKGCSDSFNTIEPDQSVGKALQLFSGFSVSALMVMDKGKPVGIFTEHDLVRCHLIFPGKNINVIPVKDVMPSKLIVTEPEDTIDEAMGMMLTAKIRHLPVVSDGQIKGILCMEDLAKKHVKVLTRELHYLQDYISDLQDAAHD